MITPFTERTCYLFLFLSLFPRPAVYLDAETCIERGKRRAPSILYRSIDPRFFPILDAILTALSSHLDRGAPVTR